MKNNHNYTMESSSSSTLENANNTLTESENRLQLSGIVDTQIFMKSPNRINENFELSEATINSMELEVSDGTPDTVSLCTMENSEGNQSENICLQQSSVINPEESNNNKKSLDSQCSAVNNDINMPFEDHNEILSSVGQMSVSNIPTDVNGDLEPCVREDESVFNNSQAALNMANGIKKVKNVNLYCESLGPKMYDVRGSLVTETLIPKNLPEAFTYLPIYGRPNSKAEVPEFYSNKIREFVGCDLDDEAFKQLADYCSVEHLKTGKEFMMITKHPGHGLCASEIQSPNGGSGDEDEDDDNVANLHIVKKHKHRKETDIKCIFLKQMKYRGIKLMPLSQEDDDMNVGTSGEPLQPGKDLLYRVRIYRPFAYSPKEKMCGRRQLLLNCDVVLLGRQTLADLRDRIVCPNDIDMRIDVSEHPDHVPTSTAKELFPSGFLFINNVIYVDTREGCRDISAPLRQWASARGIGLLPHRDLTARLDELTIRLGYPEVYIHQGNCEHLFTFSEVRLLNATDPLDISHYPRHTAVSQNQTVYCTTCAEFGAKWVVVGSERVPFDPAFFCDKCFKMYLYKDGKKIGNFKAYSYRANEINVLKPQS
ncbi:snRNA-activating protein complex subunit 3 [Achroia grisella]|uniref:snRNA-activating protein complex subunit 3 n=1 Tax=Achroia grisella TaxID=688607 RepID=UPI0027D3105D|nr:snRNA-activating protein complex subunit 3 [Achroia grisella]